MLIASGDTIEIESKFRRMITPNSLARKLKFVNKNQLLDRGQMSKLLQSMDGDVVILAISLIIIEID